MNSLFLTVSICTFNRSQSLERTLETLARQSGEVWNDAELLVIDNNCTDDTADVVERFADRLPIRRAVENKQGLSNARNCAMQEAKGEWVLFTDDDVLLDPDWLSSFIDAFVAYPEASFAGGRIVPYWEEQAPRWFQGERLDLIDGLLVWYDFGDATKPMTDNDPLPFGASFALRRSLTSSVGEFRSDLGVNGKQMGRGEETEFIERAKRLGLRGIYVGAAICHHVADPRRFTPVALYRHGRAKAREIILTERKSPRGSRLAAVLFILRGLLQLLQGRGDRFRQCLIHVGIQHGLCLGAGKAVSKSLSTSGTGR